MKRPRRPIISPAPHTCPVCGRKDVRVASTGRLYNHGPGKGYPVSVLIPGSAWAGFLLCRGSGRMLVELQKETRSAAEQTLELAAD